MMIKHAIKGVFARTPESIKKKFRNLLNADGFYTAQAQDLIDSITLLSMPITDKALQKELVKRYVWIVEIEIASFCNRTCWFCPNSQIDRKSTSIELPEQTYLKILRNLAEIDYDKSLNFHRFNEPLADKELLLRRVKQARELLPKAQFTIFTNGDYAERAYFEALGEAGVNAILMSYYYGKEKSFDKERTILPAMRKMSQKLGLAYDVVCDDEEEYRVRFDVNGLQVDYRVWNPNVGGQSRGGSLESMKRAREIDSGCFQGAMSFYVDYNGLVMPCCNTRSDVQAHKDFILGDCNTHDMFEIFFSERYSKLRQELFLSPRYHRHKLACSSSINKICADCSARRVDSFLIL